MQQLRNEQLLRVNGGNAPAASRKVQSLSLGGHSEFVLSGGGECF